MPSYSWNKHLKAPWALIGWACMLLVGLEGCQAPKQPASAPKPGANSPALPPDLGGIPNRGNTCYLNAVMQVLAKLYPDTFMGHRGALAQAGQALVEKIKTDQGYVTTQEADSFLDALVATGWPKDGGARTSQQDPEEVFSHILDKMGATKPLRLWELKKTPKSKDPEKDGYDEKAELPMQSDGTQGQFIDSMIAGLNKENTSQGKTFQEYVNKYLSKIEIELSASPNGKVYKRSQIQSPPELLAIQAKRFGSNEGKLYKAQEHLEEPFSLTIGKEQQYKPPTEADISYNLEAFILHIGSSITGGHYVAYIQRKGQWTLYNDSAVSAVPPTSAEKAAQQAYLFFFRKTSKRP